MAENILPPTETPRHNVVTSFPLKRVHPKDSTRSSKVLTEIVELDPTARAFLNSLRRENVTQIQSLPIDDARMVLRELQSGPVTKLPAEIEDLRILGGPSGEVSIRIVRPKGVRGILPCVMYFHGGGWVLGDASTHDRLVREIANGANSAVVFVNFSPSPEVRYPFALEEAYAATKWIHENGRSINIDPTRIAVAGDSAGGNMAAAVTLLAKERKGPKIVYQILYYPVTDANFETGSYRQFADGYFLTRNAMKAFWANYAKDPETRNEPTTCPLRAKIDDLKGLPPALIITGEADVLRDEGEAYARKLIEAGVHVHAIRYPGMIHDFVMLNALSQTPAARGARYETEVALKNIFSKNSRLNAKDLLKVCRPSKPVMTLVTVP